MTVHDSRIEAMIERLCAVKIRLRGRGVTAKFFMPEIGVDVKVYGRSLDAAVTAADAIKSASKHTTQERNAVSSFLRSKKAAFEKSGHAALAHELDLIASSIEVGTHRDA